MRIPGTDEALEHLARWAGRGRWKRRVYARHRRPLRAGVRKVRHKRGRAHAEALGESGSRHAR